MNSNPFNINRYSVNCLIVISFLFAILFLGYSFWFIQSSINTYVKSDGYYWVKNVIKPFIKNGFSWDQVFYVRGSDDHVQPLTKALYLLNTKWFNLDFRIFGIIGFFSLILSTLLMTYHNIYQKKLIDRSNINNKLISIFIFIIFQFIFFNYNSVIQYGYELILVNMLYSLLFPVIFIILLDLYLTGKKINFFWILAGALIMTFSGSTNSLYLLCSIFTSVSILFLSYKNISIKNNSLIIIITLLLLFMLQKYIFSILPLANNTMYELNSNNFPDWKMFYNAIFLAFGATVISSFQVNILFNKNNNFDFIFFVGVMFFILILLVYYYYFKNKQYHESIIPIIALTMYLITITGIIIKRGPMYGEVCTLYPRYIKHYNIIYIGLVWICINGILFKSYKSTRLVSIIFFILFILTNSVFLINSAKQIKYVIAANVSVKNKIMKSVKGKKSEISSIPVWARPVGWQDNDLLEIQNFLYINKLTFFNNLK